MSKKEIISNYIYLKISSGEWARGKKIPSENELAHKFNVSRQTIRLSYKGFVVSGIIESKQGSGYYVSKGIFFPFTSVKEFTGAEKTSLKKVDFIIEKIPQLSILSSISLEKRENVHSFIKLYFDGNDGLICAQHSLINKSSISKMNYEQANKSLIKFIVMYGKKIISIKSVAYFGRYDLLDKHAKTMGWKDEYPYIISVLIDIEGWVEIAFRILDKKHFIHTSNYSNFK